LNKGSHLNLIKEAAKCYYNGKLFFEAAEIYSELKLFHEVSQCGDSLMKENEPYLAEKNTRLKQAAWCYEICQNFEKLFLVFEKIPDFDSWMTKLKQYRDKIYCYKEKVIDFIRKFTIHMENIIVDNSSNHVKMLLHSYTNSLDEFMQEFLEPIFETRKKFEKLQVLAKNKNIIKWNVPFSILFYLFNETFHENLAKFFSLQYGYDILFLINKLIKRKYIDCEVKVNKDYALKLENQFSAFSENRDLIMHGILINPVLFLDLKPQYEFKGCLEKFNAYISMPLEDFKEKLKKKEFFLENLANFNGKEIKFSPKIERSLNIFEKILATLEYILIQSEENEINREKIEAMLESNGLITLYIHKIKNLLFLG
jgi:hypothetical protein